MSVNPWEDNLNRSSSESDDGCNSPDDGTFQRREEGAFVYESKYFKDDEGNLCEEVVTYRSVIRRVRCSATARNRIASMVPFGKELNTGTKAGQSLRTPEVFDWARDKSNTIMAQDKDDDFTLSCYGGKQDMNNPFRKRGNFLEDLFSKLTQTALLTPEDLEKSAVAAGSRPGSAMNRAEPRRMLGGPPEERTIRVSNLTQDITETHLQGLFKSLEKSPAKIVKIEKCYIPKDEVDGSSRGFAFVTFAEAKYAKMAIEKLDRHNFQHVVLSVEIAKPPKNRQPEGERRMLGRGL